MQIPAIDDHHASMLADEQARRNAARLSLFLNHGLYRPEHALRWTYGSDTPDAPPESRRRQAGYVSAPPLTTMPRKGEVCPLGQYGSSIADKYAFAARPLSVPRECRRILRSVDQAPPELRIAFDRGSRLYQVGAVVGRQFPSAGLAYRVAAIDAISRANGDRQLLAAFIRKHATPEPGLDTVIDYLWGSVRSAHFHGGEFPLGEFSPDRFLDPLLDADQSAHQMLHFHCSQLTREVIVRWLLEETAGITDTERTDDSIGESDA
jgi:hypothetical protein